MKKTLLSGGRPTGKLHLGHYLGAFKNFSKLQRDYNSYLVLSDIHFLTTKNSKIEIATIEINSINMVIDCIAMGIDIDSTTFYLQSSIPELTHIFIIFQNYINYTRALQTPSLLEMKKHSKSDDVSLGLLSYPVMEAGDIFALNADIVPVGRDNIDHLAIAQEIIKKINFEFDVKYTIPSCLTDEKTNYLVGIDGSEKMSKSLDNAIYIRDDEYAIKSKVNNMIWHSECFEKNVVAQYLKVFDGEYGEQDKLKSDILCGYIDEKKAKNLLIDVLMDLLMPMQERIKPYIKNKKEIYELLFNGSKKARNIVCQQLESLKSDMGLFQFN